MTTLAPPPESAPAPASAPEPAETIARYPRIRANLLPDEVLAARRLAALKNRLGIGLAALLALLIAGYGLSWWQTSSARGDLSAAQQATVHLQAQQRTFGPLLATQQQASTVQGAMSQLMVGDLPWPTLLGELASAAPAGVTIDSVQASMTSGAASAGAGAQAGIGVLNQTGQRSVGTLALTGTAPDQKTVAAFVDKLSTIKGLAAPFPGSVGNHAAGALQFSVSVLITADALGGRFTPPAAKGK